MFLEPHSNFKFSPKANILFEASEKESVIIYEPFQTDEIDIMDESYFDNFNEGEFYPKGNDKRKILSAKIDFQPAQTHFINKEMDRDLLWFPTAQSGEKMKPYLNHIFTKTMLEDKETSIVIPIGQERLSQESTPKISRKSVENSNIQTKHEVEELRLWGVSIQNIINSNLRYPHCITR